MNSEQNWGEILGFKRVEAVKVLGKHQYTIAYKTDWNNNQDLSSNNDYGQIMG